MLLDEQIGALGLQPLSGVIEQVFCLRQTFGDSGIGDRVAFVIIEVALFAQGIKDNYDILCDTHSFRQGLQGRLMVTRLAGRSAITIGPEPNHGALHDRLVGHVETVIRAQLRQLSIDKITFGGGEQTLQAARRSIKDLEAMNGQQVFQGRFRFR